MSDSSKKNSAVPDPIDVSIGSRLRQQRLSMGLSQPALAKTLGVTFQQIQKYERGSNRIVASRLFRLSQVLKVPGQYFFQDLEGTKPAQSAGERRIESDDPTSPERVLDPVTRRDTLRLVRDYNKIGDAGIRRQICALVKSIGDRDCEPEF